MAQQAWLGPWERNINIVFSLKKLEGSMASSPHAPSCVPEQLVLEGELGKGVWGVGVFLCYILRVQWISFMDDYLFSPFAPSLFL